MTIAVLGPVQLTGAAGRGPALERKARELLAVLALRSPDAVAVAELADLLWDEPPPSATKTIQAHVSRVRTALAAAGVDATVERVGHLRYALRAAPGVLDRDEVAAERTAARAARAAGRADEAAAALARARARWRGDPELPATAAAAGLAARWTEERRAVVREHLDAVVAGSDPGAAVPELEAWARAEPSAEPAWVLLVRALGRGGDPPAALRAYQRARDALGAVGLEPGPALRQAEADVLAGGDEGPEPPAPPPAPAPPGADEVRYARDAGPHIAFVTVPGGPGDVLLLNPGLISIDGFRAEPHGAAAVAALAAWGRVVAFDRRGIGLSDRSPAVADASAVGAWVDDAVTVLTAIDAGPALVVANADTGLVALALAAIHPERVRAVVLVHGYARYVRADDYPYGVDALTARATSSDVVAVDDRAGGFDPLSHIAVSVAGDPDFRRWWDAMGRRAASPRAAAALHEVIYAADVRPLVPAVGAPVLLVARRSCASYDVGHARYLAAALPAARLAVVPGADELWFTGPLDPVLAAVDDFLADLGP